VNDFFPAAAANTILKPLLQLPEGNGYHWSGPSKQVVSTGKGCFKAMAAYFIVNCLEILLNIIEL